MIHASCSTQKVLANCNCFKKTGVKMSIASISSKTLMPKQIVLSSLESFSTGVNNISIQGASTTSKRLTFGSMNKVGSSLAFCSLNATFNSFSWQSFFSIRGSQTNSFFTICEVEKSNI